MKGPKAVLETPGHNLTDGVQAVTILSKSDGPATHSINPAIEETERTMNAVVKL
jgi:hypothetical protein